MTDWKHALRRLARSRGFVAAACLSLALGIGGNAAAFTVVYAVLLRSLPVDDPQSLALVSSGTQYSMSFPAYTYLRDNASTIDGLVAFRAQPLNVSAGGTTERMSGMLVSGNYFDVLGVGMIAGTPIGPDDAEGVGGRRGLVVVVSYDYWQGVLNGDASVPGSTLSINGHTATIVGIAPRGFRGTRVGSRPAVFVPIGFGTEVFGYANWLTNPRNNWTRLIARLGPGTTMSQAQAAMTASFQQFNRDVILPLTTNDRARQDLTARAIRLEPGQAGLMEMRNVRPTLVALMGLVGLGLLMACVNVAGLMVARAERLHRATGIAIALGASRVRLWRLSAMENLVIGVGGVALGLLMAPWLRNVLVQLVPGSQELDTTMDARVLGATVVAGFLMTSVLAFVTARHTTRVGVVGVLRGAALATGLRLRQGLVVTQLALSVLALMAASLFTRTLASLNSIDPGFDQEGVLIASTATDGLALVARADFYEGLLQQVRALPGVSSAALANAEPLRVNTGWTVFVQPDPRGPTEQVEVSVLSVTPDYFRTMGIALLRGREFDERDRSEASTPVVVNAGFAEALGLPGTEPIGASFIGNGNMRFEIIGVVGNGASLGLRDLDRYNIYVPGGQGVLHVRSALPAATLTASVRAVVQRLDPQVPVFDVRTIGEQIDLAIGRERTFSTLSLTFSILALVLSSVGLFGLMANAVSRRTKELGVRLALGATPYLLLRSVVGESIVLVALGVIVGLPVAWLMARTIRSLFFGIGLNDWQTLAVPVAVLAAVAVNATWIPARRAACVDPLVALRSE